MKIAVVILAGGAGQRIGGAKPMRLLGGRTLLSRALGHARQWSDDVAVAVRCPSQLGDTNARWIIDDETIEGPLGGLRAGLEFASGLGADATLSIAADIPFLPTDLARALSGAIGRSNAAIASSGGRLHPACGLWRPVVAGELRDYLKTGRRSLGGLAEACGFVAVEWGTEPFDPFLNINSPQDLELAERLLGRS